MTTAALLSSAASLISTSAAWCTKANARNAAGVWTPIDHSDAVAWDIFGALKKAQLAGSYSVSDFEGALAHVRAKIPAGFHHDNQDIEFYNDSLTFSQVAAIFS